MANAEYYRNYRQKRKITETEEEAETRRAYHRDYYRKRKDSASDSDVKACAKRREYQCDFARKKRSLMTENELRAAREKDRVYQKERRDRLIASMSDEERKEYFKYLYEERKRVRL